MALVNAKVRLRFEQYARRLLELVLSCAVLELVLVSSVQSYQAALFASQLIAGPFEKRTFKSK